MQWLNEPSSWQRTGDVLTVNVDPGTDFWRETGYGYIRDSGHVYGELLGGDLDVSVRVRATFAGQYDQAGIMLRVDARLWLKTGMEFFEGRPRLSTVLTLGRSSWMVTDLPEGTDEIRLRASRRGDAVEIRYMVADGPAELAALLFLPAGREVLAGVMCAAPEGPGFGVTFHELRIDDREWPEAGEGEAAGGWAGEPDREEAAQDEAAWAYRPAGNAGFQWVDDLPDDVEPEWASAPGGDAGAEGPAFAASAEAVGPGTPDAGEPEGGEPEGPSVPVGGAEPERHPTQHGEARPDWSGPAVGDATAGPVAGDAAADPVAGDVTADPAADWERLVAVAKSRSSEPEPAEQPGDAAEPDPPSANGQGGHREELPESIADDQTEPELPAAAERPPHRRSLRKKAPADLPAPVDPADEWISLLTADD